MRNSFGKTKALAVVMGVVVAVVVMAVEVGVVVVEAVGGRWWMWWL